MAVIVFKTLKKHRRLILRQPFMSIEKYKTGDKKGKVKSKKRAQFCETLDSIYVEEQRKLIDNPEVSPQYFKNGYLKVDEDDTKLLEALRTHEDNEANGGKIFKEVNLEEEELFELKELEKTDEVKTQIAKASDSKLLTAGVWFFGTSYLNRTISSIKLKLREAVDLSQKTTPKYDFRNKLSAFFKAKNTESILITVIALKEGVIKIKSGKTIVWSDSDEHIYTSSQNKYVIKDFSNYISTDEKGIQVQGHIAEKIQEYLEE